VRKVEELTRGKSKTIMEEDQGHSRKYEGDVRGIVDVICEKGKDHI
jgi:hypothetical protein